MGGGPGQVFDVVGGFREYALSEELQFEANQWPEGFEVELDELDWKYLGA